MDGHHIHHWTDGGETSLKNTVLLCTRHHTLVHEGGFQIVVDEDCLRFLDRRGEEVPQSCTAADVRMTLPPVAPQLPGWDGCPVDYEAAIDCLSS